MHVVIDAMGLLQYCKFQFAFEMDGETQGSIVLLAKYFSLVVHFFVTKRVVFLWLTKLKLLIFPLYIYSFYI